MFALRGGDHLGRVVDADHIAVARLSELATQPPAPATVVKHGGGGWYHSLEALAIKGWANTLPCAARSQNCICDPPADSAAATVVAVGVMVGPQNLNRSVAVLLFVLRWPPGPLCHRHGHFPIHFDVVPKVPIHAQIWRRHRCMAVAVSLV